MDTSSPSLPFTSDPALFNDWEEEQINPVVLSTSNPNSDDFEAWHLVQQETIARKNKAGEVIQHRAWPLTEVFRSEADYAEGSIKLQHIYSIIKIAKSSQKLLCDHDKSFTNSAHHPPRRRVS